jgi:hypothetical protein
MMMPRVLERTNCLCGRILAEPDTRLSAIGPNYHGCDVKGRLETARSGDRVLSNDACKLSFREQKDGVQS